MAVPTKFRVAICGGGLGGLSLALALVQYVDVAIDIYEAAAHFENVNAGLAIWGRGLAVLRKLGLEERLRKIATALSDKSEHTQAELRRADRTSGGEQMGQLTLSATFGVNRSQFIALLADALVETGRVRIHFGKRSTDFVQRENGESIQEPITLHFADSTSVTCDVLIGCEGIRSTIREKLIGPIAGSPEESRKYDAMKFSGTVTYRAVVNPEDLRKIAGEHAATSPGKMYCGKYNHLVTYSVAGGRFITFTAYSSDVARRDEWESGPMVAEAKQQELIHQFKHFEPEVQTLLKCIHKASRSKVYDIDPLEFWSRGRVTLLGDAAHATLPFIAAGDGQVFEDAYVLSRLLGSPAATRDTLPYVLLAYERVRRPRANEVILCSREAGRAFEFMGEYENSANEDVARGLNKVAEWLFEGKGDPDDDVGEAEKLLQELIQQKTA